jgi:hypothetical protein
VTLTRNLSSYPGPSSKDGTSKTVIEFEPNCKGKCPDEPKKPPPKPQPPKKPPPPKPGKDKWPNPDFKDHPPTHGSHGPPPKKVGPASPYGKGGKPYDWTDSDSDSDDSSSSSDDWD